MVDPPAIAPALCIEVSEKAKPHLPTKTDSGVEGNKFDGDGMTKNYKFCVGHSGDLKSSSRFIDGAGLLRPTRDISHKLMGIAILLKSSLKSL